MKDFMNVPDADLPVAFVTEVGSFYLATPAMARFVYTHEIEIRRAIRSQQGFARFTGNSLGAWFLGYVEGRMFKGINP